MTSHQTTEIFTSVQTSKMSQPVQCSEIIFKIYITGFITECNLYKHRSVQPQILLLNVKPTSMECIICMKFYIGKL